MANSIELILSLESIDKIKSVIEQMKNKKLEIVGHYSPKKTEIYTEAIDAHIKVLEWFLSGKRGEVKIFKPKAE